MIYFLHFFLRICRVSAVEKRKVNSTVISNEKENESFEKNEKSVFASAGQNRITIPGGILNSNSNSNSVSNKTMKNDVTSFLSKSSDANDHNLTYGKNNYDSINDNSNNNKNKNNYYTNDDSKNYPNKNLMSGTYVKSGQSSVDEDDSVVMSPFSPLFYAAVDQSTPPVNSKKELFVTKQIRGSVSTEKIQTDVREKEKEKEEKTGIEEEKMIKGNIREENSNSNSDSDSNSNVNFIDFMAAVDESVIDEKKEMRKEKKEEEEEVKSFILEWG